MGRDPGEIYRELTREFGEPVYERVEAPATPEQKEIAGETLAAAGPDQGTGWRKNPGHPHHAPGNGAPIGGLKVVAESGWFAARPSGTEDIYKIYAESFRGADHLRRIQEEAQTIVSDAFAAGRIAGKWLEERTMSRTENLTQPDAELESFSTNHSTTFCMKRIQTTGW
jgi:phosphoglucomutase